MSQKHFSENTSPSEDIRRAWVREILNEEGFKAWTTTGMRRAATRLNLDEATQTYTAPNGVSDLLDQFFDDQLASIKTTQISRENGTTQSVRDGVLTWLDQLATDKPAVQAAFERANSLVDGPKPFAYLYKTADTLWAMSAEPIGNYNDNSRRILLAVALMDILRHWLQADDDTTADDMKSYIETRLRQISTTGKQLGQVLNIFKPR